MVRWSRNPLMVLTGKKPAETKADRHGRGWGLRCGEEASGHPGSRRGAAPAVSATAREAAALTPRPSPGFSRLLFQVSKRTLPLGIFFLFSLQLGGRAGSPWLAIYRKNRCLPAWNPLARSPRGPPQCKARAGQRESIRPLWKRTQHCNAVLTPGLPTGTESPLLPGQMQSWAQHTAGATWPLPN